MQNIVKFFELVKGPASLLQVGGLKDAVSIEPKGVPGFIEENQRDIYFLAGVSDSFPHNERANDDVIVEKSYVAFDIDIRKQLEDKSDQALDQVIQVLSDFLKTDEFFQDWGALVCSGNGLHIYYFNDVVKLSGKKKIYSEGYSTVVGILNSHLRVALAFAGIKGQIEADIACKNVGRIMRIPGSYNHKGEEKKHVRLIELRDKKSNMLYEILSMGMSSGMPETIEDESFYKPKLFRDPKDLVGFPFWEQLRRLENKMVLEKLSGTYLVNNEVYTFERRGGLGGWHICMHGKSIDAWIDADGYIGSPYIQGRTWIDWLINYPSFKRSAREVAQWAKSTFDLPDTEDEMFRHLTAKGYFSDEGKFILPHHERPFTWGHPILDESFYPIEKGDYVVFVGQSASGKTTFAFNWGISNALKGVNVAFISLEMKPERVISKYATERVGITKERIIRREFTMADELKAKQIALSLPSNFFLPEFTADSITVGDIQKYVTKHSIDLVIIDNFGFIDQEGDEFEAARLISRQLVQFAHNFGVTVVILHHFKKGGSFYYKGLRNIDDIRGSGKIRDDADFVLQIAREVVDNFEVEQTAEQKASSYIALEKDRFGGDSRNIKKLYFKLGQFFDRYEPDSNEINF